MNSKSGVEGAAVLAFGSYEQVEAQAIEKATRENVDVAIYRTKSGRFTLVKPSDDGVRKFEPHNTIAAPGRSSSTTPNCPILVGHLNNLTKQGGDSAAIALALVAILDDVEGIAGLVDHRFPAERHAIERAKHIAEMAARLQSLLSVRRLEIATAIGRGILADGL